MSIPHLFNFAPELCISDSELLVLSVQSIHIFNCVLQLLFQSKIVAHYIADFLLVFKFVIEREFVQQLASLRFEQAFSLQVLLIVVDFELTLLQDIFFAINLSL